jgi:hypothetical protein
MPRKNLFRPPTLLATTRRDNGDSVKLLYETSREEVNRSNSATCDCVCGCNVGVANLDQYLSAVRQRSRGKERLRLCGHNFQYDFLWREGSLCIQFCRLLPVYLLLPVHTVYLKIRTNANAEHFEGLSRGHNVCCLFNSYFRCLYRYTTKL